MTAVMNAVRIPKGVSDFFDQARYTRARIKGVAMYTCIVPVNKDKVMSTNSTWITVCKVPLQTCSSRQTVEPLNNSLRG